MSRLQTFVCSAVMRLIALAVHSLVLPELHIKSVASSAARSSSSARTTTATRRTTSVPPGGSPVEMSLHAYTIGTRMNPLLFYLQHSAEMHNLAILPRGMGDPILQAWGRKALQQKLVYHRDEAMRLRGRKTVLFFVDAYDALVEAGEAAILTRFQNLQNAAPQCRVFFSGEKHCGSACIEGYVGSYASSPAKNETKNAYNKYLCSGGFVGEADAVADLFEKYPINEFARSYPKQSEQYYWALVWGGEYKQQLESGGTYKTPFCLEDESKIFASNRNRESEERPDDLGYLQLDVRNQQVVAEPFVGTPPEVFRDHPGFVLDFARKAGNRIFGGGGQTGGNTQSSRPVVLHWNGFWKTNLYRVYLELTHQRLGRQTYWQNQHGVIGAAAPGPSLTTALGALMPPELLRGTASSTPRSLEAYAQLNGAGGVKPLSGASEPASATASSLSRSSISMPDFARASISQDWDPDAPTYLFLGGRLSFAISTSGQAAYLSFLLLLLIRVCLVAGGSLFRDHREIRIRSMKGSSAGDLEEDTASMLELETVVGSTREAGKMNAAATSAEEQKLPTRAGAQEEQLAARGLPTRRGVVSAEAPQPPLSSPLRPKLLRRLTVLVFAIFVVTSVNFLYEMNWLFLDSLRMTQFSSLGKSGQKRFGGFLMLWLDRMPALFPLLLSAVAYESLWTWMKREKLLVW